MKRSVLILAAFASVLATGLALTQAGWFQPAGGRAPGGGRGQALSADGTHDRFAREAAARWRRSQASHWRACLLQR
jgi:hypothetical protein